MLGRRKAISNGIDATSHNDGPQVIEGDMSNDIRVDVEHRSLAIVERELPVGAFMNYVASNVVEHVDGGAEPKAWH